MNAGEFFVNLGVTGSEKTLSAFASVKAGLGDMKSMSVETKAAIIGALYAIEQMTASSNRLGSTFTNTSALLGMPIKTLQQYSNAAEIANASSQDMLGTFGQIQAKLKAMNLNEGVPKWMGRLSEVTGFSFNGNNVEAFANHPEQFLQLMQRYAQKEKDIPWRNEVLKQFIGSEAIESALVRGGFNSKTLNKIPILSGTQMGQLDANRKKWTEIGLRLQRDFDQLNSSSGVTDFTTSLLHLIEAIDKLDQRFGVFEKIGKLFGAVGSEMDIVSWALRLGSGEDPEKIRKEIKGSGGIWAKLLQFQQEHMGSTPTQQSTVNVHINVDAKGNSNAHEIAHKVKDVMTVKMFDERLNKRLNQPARQNSGQTTGKTR